MPIHMTRAVTDAEAEILKNKGWKAIDLHCHTTASHDVFPTSRLDPQAIYAKAKERGMSFVTFTDHDTIAAYKNFNAKDLIRGVEISILDKKRVGHTIHINIYGFNDKQYQNITTLAEKGNLISLVNYLKKQKLAFIYNHPYWAEKKEICNYLAIRRVAKYFPVIEVNAGRVPLKNDLAIRLARLHGKGIAAGTDSHTANVGAACTLAPGRTFKECWKNIVAGNAVIVRKDLTIRELIAEVNRRLDALLAKDIRADELKTLASKWKTGIWPADLLIRLVIATRKIWIGRLLMKTIVKIINHSHVPAVLYVRSEHKPIRVIHETLTDIN